MTSVAQIVRKIIDDLSEGVSELVLVVIILSEQGAPLPDELPPNAHIVNNTANNLAKIARQLAASEYVDFEEIQKDINQASDDVNSATDKLGKAVDTLSKGGNLRSGWNNLVDACRVMSGKTILLLQIVYGAELKRLQAAADRLTDAISNIQVGNLRDPGEQQRLASEIAPITQQAVKLAQYLNERAADSGISPFAQEQLKKAADDLVNGTQKLIDATNEALVDPEQAPKMRAALDDLNKKIQGAKKLANEVAPEEPPMENLKKLLPLLEKAQAKAAQVPQTVKKNPKDWPRLEKEVKDAAQDVVKAIRPNPKMKRDADKVEEDLRDQILAARNALQHPNNPEANKKLDDATQKLLDALNNLKKRDPEAKLTPEQKNEIQNALENLRKGFGPALNKKPEDKEQDAYERLKDDLDNLKKAVRDQDPKMANIKAKQAVQAAKDLANAMADPQRLKRLPEAQREPRTQAAKDILDNLPKFVKNAKALAGEPANPQKQEDLMDAIKRLQRAADRPLKPKDEKDFRDNYNDILNGLKKAQDGIKNNDPKATNDALDDLARAIGNLRKVGDRLKEKNPNPDSVEKPLSELEKAFAKLKQKAPLAAKGDPSAAKEVNESIPQVKKALNDLNNATHALDIAPLEDVEDALDNVVLAASSDEPTRVAPAVKDLVAKINDLGEHFNSLPDLTIKQIGEDALEQIKPLIRDFAVKAKEVAEGKASPDDLEAIGDKIKAPLAEVKKAMDPNALDRDTDLAAANVKRALQPVRVALNKGDIPATRVALNDLNDIMDKFNDIADQAISRVADPKKKNLLAVEAKELKELAGDIRRLDPTKAHEVRAVLDQIPARLDDFNNTIRNTAADDLRKAQAKANNLLATLGSIDDDDMDLGDLLETAGNLRDLMRGLITNASSVARQIGATDKELSDASRAALEMDALIRNLEGGGKPINLHKPEIDPLGQTRRKNEDIFENISLKNAVTFDQVLAAVAKEMHEAAQGMSEEADNLAVELAKLAKAARGGSKQEVLLSAKAAAAYINAFSKQIESLASKIPGRNFAEKKEQDNLLRYRLTLSNYATQLKILSSVKAASIEESRDTDATLKTLTMNLGDVIGASLRSMSTTRDAIFGGKIPR